MYEEKLKIPLLGNPNTTFHSKYNLVIAVGYLRILIGERGPYIEFNNVLKENIHIPKNQKWRLNHPKTYYIEYRSNCESNIKIYYQLKRVNYADYEVGLFYISPFDLLVNGETIIDPLKKKIGLQNGPDIDSWLIE